MLDAGVPPDSLSHSYERVPIHALSQIISRAVSSELGPLFGLKFAENIHATTYHCYGLMLISSPTLRQFCLRLARYYPWVTTNKSVSFDVAGDTARLIYHCHGDVHDSPAARLARISGWAATWVRMLRMVSSPGFAPKAVKFSSPAPLGFVEDYHIIFAVLSSLVAMLTPCALTPRPSTRPWQVVMPSWHGAVNGKCLTTSIRWVRWIWRPRFVWRFSISLPAGNYGRADVAHWLGLEEKRLATALREEGLSHHQILLKTRQELAAELVSYSDISINEISYQLGFSDCSNFARSYRKWFGSCPSERRMGER